MGHVKNVSRSTDQCDCHYLDFSHGGLDGHRAEAKSVPWLKEPRLVSGVEVDGMSSNISPNVLLLMTDAQRRDTLGCRSDFGLRGIEKVKGAFRISYSTGAKPG